MLKQIVETIEQELDMPVSLVQSKYGEVFITIDVLEYDEESQLESIRKVFKMFPISGKIKNQATKKNLRLALFIKSPLDVESTDMSIIYNTKNFICRLLIPNTELIKDWIETYERRSSETFTCLKWIGPCEYFRIKDYEVVTCCNDPFTIEMFEELFTA